MIKFTLRYARYVLAALATAAFLGAGFSEVALASCGGCTYSN